ncbi:DUF3617 domain-containing protein [Solimonas soli]|uniref:DUF3617 domain-containing protein n=1 Tax=Solimonas soli TaxID=413479 RepID=UPI0004B65A03|nr:DUF3617 family protein [Solimonas soli]
MNASRWTAAALALACGAAFGAGIKEGRWTYTTTMNMPDMPAMPKIDASKLPPGMKLPQAGAGGMQMSFERCISNADLLPRDEQTQERCKITKMERHGDTVDWASVCETPRGPMNATGTAVYSGDRMTSTTHITGSARQGRPIDVTQTIAGRYVGPCSSP